MALKSLRIRLLLFVGLPALLAAFYFTFLASDMFISEARFSIRGPENGGSPEWLSLFGQGGGSSTAGDAYVVQDYIRSMGLLAVLEEQLQLRRHYQSEEADFISRLADQATAEEFLDYYREVVKVAFDPGTGILTLRTRAYTPEMARDLGLLVLEQSEKLVNDLRDRALQDALALARTELSTAEQRVTTVREALKGFRSQSNLLNPEAAAGAVLSLVAELEGETAKARIQLAENRSYLREDSAQVASLRSRIAALEDQVAAEKTRLTGKDRRVLNDVMADYERLMVEREFAEKHYVSALSSLEMARIRAEGKSRYLVAFAPPTLPEESLWPRRFLSTGVAFAATALIFGIASLVIAAIREHAGF
jgi:capsular polysaccharide transport system permease protein